MNLLVIRHAIAYERDSKRWPDDGDRPLTPAGMIKCRKAAAGLAKLMDPPDRVLTSPLVRAKQTAEILHRVGGWPRAVECAALEPQAPVEALIKSLGANRDKLVAVVGHQPHLGKLLSMCLTGDDGTAIELKKSAAVYFSFPGAPKAGRATLRWLATPRMLRAAR